MYKAVNFLAIIIAFLTYFLASTMSSIVSRQLHETPCDSITALMIINATGPADTDPEIIFTFLSDNRTFILVTSKSEYGGPGYSFNGTESAVGSSEDRQTMYSWFPNCQCNFTQTPEVPQEFEGIEIPGETWVSSGACADKPFQV